MKDVGVWGVLGWEPWARLLAGVPMGSSVCHPSPALSIHPLPFPEERGYSTEPSKGRVVSGVETEVQSCWDLDGRVQSPVSSGERSGVQHTRAAHPGPRAKPLRLERALSPAEMENGSSPRA